MSDLIIPVDDINDENKIDNKYDNSKPHNGKHIDLIEISPNGNYLITFSKEDKSIVGWNVENTNEGQLKVDNKGYDIEEDYLYLHQVCVSDDKKLVYVDDNGNLKIIDMNNNNQEIKLCFDSKYSECAFNSKGEFILYYTYNNIIWVYSTKTKNNKWNCKKIYKLHDNTFVISISKYNKLYLYSNDYYFYEWDILTEKCIRLFGNDESVNCRIARDDKFICLKMNASNGSDNKKIVIYSIELESPIVSLDINDNEDIQPCNFNYIDSDLYYSLLNLFNNGLYGLFNAEPIPNIGIWNPIMEYYWKECLSRLNQTENLLVPPFLFDDTTKFIYKILDGYVWKVKIENTFKIRNELEEQISEMIEHPDELNNENDKIIESWNIYLDMDNESDDHVNNPYVERELTLDLKLKVNIDGEKIQLQAFKKNNDNDEWDLICTSNDEHNIKNIEKYRILGIKLYNDNDIIILTTIGIFIYNFNESDKSISLNYFYHHEEKIKNELQYYPKSPLPNCDKYSIHGIWKSVNDNKLNFLKYGVGILLYAIEEHNVGLIDGIYKKCIYNFNQDLKNNRMFLSIITSTILLNESYPEYILRYSLEAIMIIDAPFYTVTHQNSNLHLYSFSQYSQTVDLSKSILWSKYVHLLKNKLHSGVRTLYWIYYLSQLLIALLTFPIYFAIFHILSKYHFINSIYAEVNGGDGFHDFYFYISSKFSKGTTTTPTITFMIPYIKFVNYPQDYNWFLELIKPQPSPFVKTISRDIYKTWDGEALIKFKWHTYGKYYYAIIWIMFMAFFGCFITAATISLANDVRNKLLITSMTFGFIHLITEVRQIIYDPNNWIRDLWNFFDIIAYLFPICTSIYWIQTDNMITWLLSFSCLFLYIKFVMFFRVFESFGVYFAIIISVGEQIVSFLVVILIIIIGFAHAFYILLSPKSDNDPNSPLNLATTYNRILDDGTIDPNPSLIQPPDDNTNMFEDYRTSILAMYFFLTGDSGSLSNWSYKENPALVMLTVLFSLLVVVYLMNLFIGLLSNAIERDNNRVSYLIQKAETLAEIELFYLLPHQRRWQSWFPDTIYYYANVDKTREKVKEMINEGEWNTNELPELREDLLKKLNIQHNT